MELYTRELRKLESNEKSFYIMRDSSPYVDVPSQQLKELKEATPIFIKRAFEDLGECCTKLVPSIIKPPIFKLKKLLQHLKYTFLGNNSSLPIIISSKLTSMSEEKLMEMLKWYKSTIGWSLTNIMSISPSLCMHMILMEEKCKTSIEHQR